jgi:hypothetical protein
MRCKSPGAKTGYRYSVMEWMFGMASCELAHDEYLRIQMGGELTSEGLTLAQELQEQ